MGAPLCCARSFRSLEINPMGDDAGAAIAVALSRHRLGSVKYVRAPSQLCLMAIKRLCDQHGVNEHRSEDGDAAVKKRPYKFCCGQPRVRASRLFTFGHFLTVFAIALSLSDNEVDDRAAKELEALVAANFGMHSLR